MPSEVQANVVTFNSAINALHSSATAYTAYTARPVHAAGCSVEVPFCGSKSDRLSPRGGDVERAEHWFKKLRAQTGKFQVDLNLRCGGRWEYAIPGKHLSRPREEIVHSVRMVKQGVQPGVLNACAKVKASKPYSSACALRNFL